jgi:glutaminase
VHLSFAFDESSTVGDATVEFSLQSVSKPFVFALVCQEIGHEAAGEKLGVNSTGLPVNSVRAIELNEDRTMNPMVNAGAIATTSLVPGQIADDKRQFVLDRLSRLAGRRRSIDAEVYRSEADHNQRNQGIAHPTGSCERVNFDPDEATDIYTKQCSVRVGATDLATAGLDEQSGDWLYEVGLPGKSGNSGGMVAIAPGKGGPGTFSPPLDEAGNSARGQRITRHRSYVLGRNLFVSKPAQPTDLGAPS